MAEPTCARCPDSDGYVERDRARVFYEVYGAGEPAIVFLSGIPFAPARACKAQIPYFAHRHTVVAFDGRGGGRSSRCTDAEEHSLDALAGDLVAVMDAAGVAAAVVVSPSLAPLRAVQLEVPGVGHAVAARHPVKFNLAVRDFVAGLTAGG